MNFFIAAMVAAVIIGTGTCIAICLTALAEITKHSQQ